MSTDLGGVVGENTPAAPRARAVDAVDARAIPSPGMLEMRDAPFGAGAPLDELEEPLRGLEFEALAGSSAPSGDDHDLHAEGVQVSFDIRFAIAAGSTVTVRGTRPTSSASRSMAGASSPASAGLPIMTSWSSTIPSTLSSTWAL